MPVPSPPPPPLAPLKEIHSLLHLVYHRNKNQHRIAKWWKSLAVLRRQIGKLVCEVEEAGRGEQGSRERVRLRCCFMNEWVFGDAFLNFTRVVADNQYSALGLMLLGTLASLQRILAPWRGRGVREVEKERKSAVLERNVESGKRSANAETEAEVEDVGESVVREKGKDAGEKIVRAEEAGTTKHVRSKDDGKAKEKKVVEKSAKKKKKKKGDAIDDLFSGLL